MAESNFGFVPGILGVLCGGALLYAVLILYRLTLHPLAKFPGPKWAAATKWYECYFDLVKEHRGQFMWEVGRMHDEYGPIVRINPDELHIKDPDMYTIIHASNPTSRDKWPPAANMLVLLAFGTIDHNLHRERRAANNSLFSNRGVLTAEPLIWSQVQKLCEAIHSNVAPNNVVELYTLSVSFAFETVTRYLLGKDLDLLNDQENAREWAGMIKSVTANTPLIKQFPWIMALSAKIPLPVIGVLNPVLARMLVYGQNIKNDAAAYMADRNRLSESTMTKNEVHPLTVYDAIQNSSLPPHDKTVERMTQEITTLITAGGDTTARMIKNAVFHLLANPEVLARLREEIIQVMPEIHSTPSVKTLKELPWLTAIIKETLRISAVLTSRLPLVLPNDLQYKDWVIPAKTPISDTIRDVLLDPNIFAEPQQFKPERWLESAEKTAFLTRYFVPFSKGTRMCPGMQFAYAEMYTTIPAIFRRFDLELYETTWERDIDTWRDCFLGDPHPESLGMRVRVVKEYT
ncbi:hypothetical protein MMC30_001329 [Trapelia coarctata]|nr:hypothetical protein [Trapelia coarctata]